MLSFRIYQINGDRDVNRMSFMRYDSLEKFQGSKDVNSNIYDKVYEGSIDGSSLEDIYKTFNYDHPEDFKGHSLSVSDIVEIVSASDIVGKIDYLKSGMSSVYTDFLEYTQEQERLREKDVDFEAHDYVGLNVPVIEKGFYFCDSFGFKKVDFEPEKTEDAFTKEMMKVLLLEPGKVARVVEVGTTLKDMHNLIGGYIDTTTPFEDGACLVSVRDGKLNPKLSLNRAIRDEKSREIIDIIAGPCFICDGSGNKLAGLSDEMIKKYETKFRLPETFVRIDGKYDSATYDPEDELYGENPEKSEYTFVASKSVPDSDGFLTDYTWYKHSNGTQVFVFGDNDIYKPEDGSFDHICEGTHEAQEWFDSYEGFIEEKETKPSLSSQIESASERAGAVEPGSNVRDKGADLDL